MYRTISIIGAGIIGSAIARIIAEKRVVERVIATRRSVEKLADLRKLGVEVTSDNRWAAREGDAILIAVKPGSVPQVLEEIRDEASGKLLISVAAGVPMALIERTVPGARVVRAMPNLALVVGESFTVYSVSRSATREDREFVRRLFSAMGLAYEVEEEALNAYTALTGSGPAYMAIFIEAMVLAGLRVGIPRDLALLGAAQVAIGTGKLIRDAAMHYASIKEMVVTPAGTTIEGLFELEGANIRRGVMRAVSAAAKRADEISRGFDRQGRG